MRRHFAIIAALLLIGAAPSADGPATGTIVGKVRLTTTIKGSGLASTIYQPRAVTRHQLTSAPEIGNVVVSLRGVAAAGPLDVSRKTIRQVHEEFLPRVVAVTRGSTVDFPNADPIFHNVFSLASAATFDLGRYPMGRSKSATFTKTGVVKVYCHIHSQMSATIVVLDHPYFVTPDTDGTFRMAGVPAGSYSIVGWHERIGERVMPVTVPAGGTATVTLDLPVEDEP